LTSESNTPSNSLTHFSFIRSLLHFSLMLRRPTRSPLFPYTTLFRSCFSTRTPCAVTPSRRAGDRTPRCWVCQDSRIPLPSSSMRSEEHTSELQSRENLVCRLLLEKKKNKLI